MTQIVEKEVTCAICSHTSTHEVIISTRLDGYPDLDGRPGVIGDFYFSTSIQRCPSCGYCATDISKGSANARELVQTQDYRSQLENPHFPILVNSFICLSMIYEKDGYYYSAGQAWLKAAWICDDRKDINGAKYCRLRAIEMLKKMDLRGKTSGFMDDYFVMLTDLLRRAEKFDEALAVYEEGLRKVKDKECKKFLEFEKKLIERRDTGPANSSTVLFEKLSQRMMEKGITKKAFTREELNTLIEEIESEPE